MGHEKVCVQSEAWLKKVENPWSRSLYLIVFEQQKKMNIPFFQTEKN